MTISEHTITTDVLVIGAGFAGCFAAIRARELGAKVVIVEQGKSGFAGRSSMGTNINRVVLPEDDFDMALKGTVLQTDYMVDQEYAEGAIAETWDRFQELLKLGANFRRDRSGQIIWYIHNTHYPPFQQRQAMWEPFGSYMHVLKVKAGAVRLGTRVLDRTVVTDLLVSDGKVVGAVGINKRNGDFYVFKARAVVMAAADAHPAACGNNPSMTGDGIAMALRAGAELRGIEFGRSGFAPFRVASGDTPISMAARLASQMRGESGAPEPKIVNARGEEFIEQYELLRRLPERQYGGPSWKNHIPAIMKECQEGRGPCFIDFGRARIEFGYVDQFSSQNGGIRINPYGISSVPGLFAGGIASDMCCAVHFSIPANIMGSHITGRRAGESAAKYAQSQSRKALDKEEISRIKAEAYAPLNRQKGITEEEIRVKLIQAWPNVDYRNETRLNKAFQNFRQLEQEAVSLKADDFHEMVKCLKIRNMLQLAQAEALAALARRESRLEHFREDYPLMDNKDWLKWVIVHGIGDRMQTYLQDIPIERWKYRPEPVLVDRLQMRKDA